MVPDGSWGDHWPVGLFGSLAVNLGLEAAFAAPLLIPLIPLPAPDDASEAMLLLRPESSAGVPLRLPDPAALLAGVGKAVVGGGEVGGPYALKGGGLYWAHCCVGRASVVGAVGEVVDGGCLTMRRGCGVSELLAEDDEGSGLSQSSSGFCEDMMCCTTEK